jgi:hypothetical protein
MPSNFPLFESPEYNDEPLEEEGELDDPYLSMI